MSQEQPATPFTVEEIPDGTFVGYRLNGGSIRYDVVLVTCEVIGLYANSQDEVKAWFGELFGSFLEEGAAQWQA